MSEQRHYYTWTIGCQMNAADTARAAAHLEAMGLAPTGEPEEADVVLVNTCVIRQQAEEKIYGRLGALSTAKKQRPGMVLALMGCLVGRQVPQSLRDRFPYVDVFLPPSDIQPLLDHLAGLDGFDEPPAPSCTVPPTQLRQDVTAFLPVVMGCSQACAYCIIPYRRGREYSRPRAELVREAGALAANGVREITLLGQIVDRYGLDLEEDIDLAGLLTDLHEIEGVDRFRFLTSHPRWMSDRLLRAVADLPKVCPHLELPVQAGHDAVLERMRRPYTAAAYRDLVGRARDLVPDVAVHTDIIVGFPGETAAQFEATRKLVEDIEFDKVHVAKYSPRPKTYAARHYADDVPADEKERRRAAIDDLQRQILARKQQRLLGSTVDILVEGRDRGRWRGRTPQNKIVFTADDRDLLGRLVTVQVDWAGPFSLVGRAADTLVETGTTCSP